MFSGLSVGASVHPYVRPIPVNVIYQECREECSLNLAQMYLDSRVK